MSEPTSAPSNDSEPASTIAADDSRLIVCPTTSYYARRILTMAGVAAVFAGWFCYDWKVTYPKRQQIYQAWLPYKDTPEKWKEIATNNGWDADPSEYAKYDEAKLAEQRNFAIGVGAVALAVFISFLRRRSTTLRADATSFTTHRGTRVPFSSVKKIDLRKWEHKGLGYVYYQGEDGELRKAELDDLYYDGTQKILDRLKAHCPPDTEIIQYEEAEASHSAEKGTETGANNATASDAESPDSPR